MAEKNEVEVMNGTAVLVTDSKGYTKLVQKPGFPEPVSINPKAGKR